ncbi:hypothetical protein ACFYXH_39580 [Streptomyces sp. NPDC002730]|uniref:hypothetical protein n=1 Tax=Streptomyces sp. NPDC002730 TaxID=3364662 RepID=UPI0036CA2C5C
MSDAPTGTSVHLALHPEHPSAVIATVSGPRTNTARALLSMLAFRPVDEHTMLLARIDHEEPYYANLAASLLRQEQATVHITPELQKEIDTEWTWAGHPMPWLNRDEIRLASAEAQQIHDEIQSGRLVIHLHADDGHTIVAAGTYQHAVSVHLHGEDHLRVVSGSYDTPNEAITEFERLYGEAVRTGPAPATDTERRPPRPPPP